MKNKFVAAFVYGWMVTSIASSGGLASPRTIRAVIRDDDSLANGFHVKGTTILDANGQPFVMRGINYPHAWYKDVAERGLAAVAKTGANVVRLVLSNGVVYQRDDESDLLRLLKICRELKMVAMLEVHDATGSDSLQDLQSAADYWVSMANALKGSERHVMINIANEWNRSFGKDAAAEWAAGYCDVIPQLRQAGLRHVLVVDAPGWGQDATAISSQGRAVIEADPLRNVVFSIHMYEVAAANAGTVQTNLDNSLAVGAPVIVGEFAAEQNHKHVEYKAILSYCSTSKHSVGWLAWSWFGNNADTSHMDMVANGPTGKLTIWGKEIVDGPQGIKSESKIPNLWQTPYANSARVVPVAS